MSNNLTVSNQLKLQAMQNELTSVSNNATVGLSSSSIPFSETTTVSGALGGEVSYPGYARQLWGLTPINLDGHDYVVPQGTVIFNPPSAPHAAVVPTQFFVLYTGHDSAVCIMGGNNLPSHPTITFGGLGVALVLNLKDFDANNP